MLELPDALRPMAAYNQWIIWESRPKPDGRMDKVPVDPGTGRPIDAHNPQHHMGADAAVLLAAARPEWGVGFVLTDTDPFWFIDIDTAYIDGAWSPVATAMCQQLQGAAVEISQSGVGLHLIGSGSVPPHSCKSRGHGHDVDLYTSGRFIALTGTAASGSAAADLTTPLSWIVPTYFPPSGPGTDPSWWQNGPDAEWCGPEEDEQLIRAALRSGDKGAAAAFGGVTFRALWEGDADRLAAAYPSDRGDRLYDASRADAALAGHLAFWTGRDCPRIERLMRQSALYREKWDRRTDYLQGRTISGAAQKCTAVYSRPAPNTDHPATLEGPRLVDGYQFLDPSAQVEHFRGCVYIQNMHRIFTPDGAILKEGPFRATYGGYVFAVDGAGEKTTRSAWEAFTESQAVRYPIAHTHAFRPDLEPGVLFRDGRLTCVNTYIPAVVDRKKGDPAPFLRHLRLLLPEGSDAEILLSYMAACVQYPGVKFQWAPLLQGVEGNGKTLFSRCVAKAVGEQYSHFPKAPEIGNKFNSWINRKVFIGIEDVHYPEGKREILEDLKPMITNDLQPVTYKGVDEITMRVCANFILNSNHKDALRKTHNDRRFAVMYTAQQNASDLDRDGMSGDYFPELYDWLRREGYAIVTEYLATYPIQDTYNPATKLHRAPRTTSTDEAIQYSAGSVEQEIMEAIDEGRVGFRGGWISSMALDRLLSQMHMSRGIPPNKRRDMLRTMRYDWHPGLKDGRTNGLVAIDGGKPKLFIRIGHTDADLTQHAAIVAAYEKAQETEVIN